MSPCSGSRPFPNFPNQAQVQNVSIMPHLFHRRDKRESIDSDDDSLVTTHRRSIFRRQSLDSEHGAPSKERRRSIFGRRSLDSEHGAPSKERRSSIFRRPARCREESDSVTMIRPEDTVVTRIYESSASPSVRRRRPRRSLGRS